MKILLAYATNSSGTLVASQTILRTLQEHSHEVTHTDIRDVRPEMLQEFELIIFGSPSWNYNNMEGQPHEFFSRFMEKVEGQRTEGKSYAVYGLGDTAYMLFCGAVDHLENFVQKLGGTLIVPSLRVDGFYFNQGENEKLVEEWSKNLASKLP